jgi:hypothetical protein
MGWILSSIFLNFLTEVSKSLIGDISSFNL